MSLFSALSSLPVKSLADVFCAAFFVPLDLEQLLAPLVDDWLESCIFLFSLTLHSQFHQFFVLLSLQVVNSFVDGRLVLEFVNVNIAFCAFGDQLGLEGASFELLILKLSFEFLSFLPSFVSLVSEPLNRVDIFLSFSFVDRRAADRGLEGAFFLEIILLFLHPCSVSLLLDGCLRLRQFLPAILLTFFLLLLEGFVDVWLERALLFELSVLIQKSSLSFLQLHLFFSSLDLIVHGRLHVLPSRPVRDT